MAKCRTLTELATRLSVSPKTISRWRQWEGFPEKVDGAWDSVEVRRWQARAVEKRSAQRRLNQSRGARASVIDARDLEEDESEDEDELEQAVLSFDAEQRKWDLEWRKARAMNEILRNQQMMGELVKKSEVAQQFAVRTHEVTSKLEGLGRKLAPQLFGRTAREIEARINEEVTAIREHFARARPLD